jgi:FtsP/CotA-like multicopper oxidase with cupredoxin domain
MKKLLFLLALLPLLSPVAATAAPSTLLNPTKIPKFAQPLPLPGPTGVPMTTGTPNPSTGNQDINLSMCEFQTSILPPGTFAPGVAPQSWVWGYVEGSCPNPSVPVDHAYVGPIVLAERYVPSQFTYRNQLGDSAASNLNFFKTSVDQTLHWADPLNLGMNSCSMEMQLSLLGTPPSAACAQNYSGPVPSVPHLHGGEVPPAIDGNPEAWFTTNGLRGQAFYTKDNLNDPADGAVYTYPNMQESAPLWFHDHTLGATRINVYAGLAGMHLISDPSAYTPANLPGAMDTIPLFIQDRMFDKAGQLVFPNQGINPEHPYWIPEFVGDTIVVNGKAWPFVNLEPRRYRLLFLNASNARPYELFFLNRATGRKGPPIWIIGTDGGLLDKPVKLDPTLKTNSKLVIMPGERYEAIVDFAGYAGARLELVNTARTPYPFGAPPSGSTTGRVLQVRVGAAAVVDNSYDPASQAALRSPMVRLADPVAGTLAPGVAVSATRSLTLNEIMGMGGPLEVLVNNTRWGGVNPDGSTRTDFTLINPGSTTGMPTYASELPNEGETEIWEIINTTADAHPIHLHLVQFQLLNRQPFDLKGYTAAYDAAFTGGGMDRATGLPYPPGVFMAGYGPPLNYQLGNSRALGGNPDVVPFLTGVPAPPLPSEAGWKDTLIMYPEQVTRIAVRFAPIDKPVLSSIDELFYPFDPSDGFSYVWHCHILDHEDNEMMRPYLVTPNASVPASYRSYVRGNY